MNKIKFLLILIILLLYNINISKSDSFDYDGSTSITLSSSTSSYTTFSSSTSSSSSYQDNFNSTLVLEDLPTIIFDANNNLKTPNYIINNVSKSTTTVRQLQTSSKNYYPIDSVRNICGDYDWTLLVKNDIYSITDIQETAVRYRNSLIQLNVNATIRSEIITKNAALYTVMINYQVVDYGDYDLILLVKISTNETIRVILEFSCNRINPEAIKFKVLGYTNFPTTFPFYKDQSPIKLSMKITGFNYTLNNLFSFLIKSTLYVSIQLTSEKDYFVALIQGKPTPFYDDLLFDIYFSDDSRVQIRVASPFPYLNNTVEDLNLKLYPPLNTKPFQLSSFYSIPFLQFESKIKPFSIQTLFYLFYPDNQQTKKFLPISHKNGITTYLAPLYDSPISLIPYISPNDPYPYNPTFYIATQINYTFSQVIRSNSFKYDFYLFYYNTTYNYWSNLNGTNSLIELKVSLLDFLTTPTLFRIYSVSSFVGLIDYPFGLTSGNSKNCTYSISIFQSPYRTLFGYFGFLDKKFGFNYPNINNTDRNSPILHNFSAINLYDRTFLVRIVASDDVSGIKAIEFTFGLPAPPIHFDLVNGTTMNGTYELLYRMSPALPKENQLSLNILIRDNTDRFLSISRFMVLSIDPYVQLDFKVDKVSYFTIDDIKYIGFRFNNINTTNQEYYNTMYLQLKDSSKSKSDSIPVVFNFYFPYERSTLFYLDWKSDGNQYWYGNILIPANVMPGSVRYYIPIFDSTYIISNSQLPPESQLNLTSVEADLLGPIFISIIQIQQVHLKYEGIFQLGWSLTIKDTPNGFSHGYIVVKGSLDHSLYNFTLSFDHSYKGDDPTDDTIIACSINSGDKFIGEYLIILNISTSCVSQNYEIINVYLEDSQGLFTTHNQIPNDPNYNMDNIIDFPTPFLNFISNSSLLLVSLNCNIEYKLNNLVEQTLQQEKDQPPPSSPMPPSYCNWIWCKPPPQPPLSQLYSENSINPTSSISESLSSTSSDSFSSSFTSTSELSSTSTSTSTSNETPTFKPKPYLGSPKIIEYTILNSNIDVGSLNRWVNVSIQVYDLSGIKSNQNPILFITDDDFGNIKVKGRLTESNETNFYYTFSTELPVGFGFPNPILISIYGLINNAGRFSGYSAQDLLNLGYQSIIQITQSLPDQSTEIIIRDSQFTNGRLYLFGRGLKKLNSVTIIRITDNSASNSLPPTPASIQNGDSNENNLIRKVLAKDSTSGSSSNYNPNIYYPNPNNTFDTIAEIVGFKPSLGDQYSVSVDSASGLLSNNIVFTPTDIVDFLLAPELPVNPPQECPGNCGAPERGYCSSSGCICFDLYVGLNCEAKIITNITQPSELDENKPTFSFPVNNSLIQDVFTQISILEIRETDIFGQIIKSHSLNQSLWTPKQLNESTFEYSVDITTNENVITNIKAILKWYDNSEDIEFAEQQVSIDPSTIKYTVIVSNYTFINELSTLELVMLASIENLSNSSKKCSLFTNGNTTTENLNFLKLQVDSKSLYGSFVKRAVRDYDETVPVYNKFSNDAVSGSTLPEINCSPSKTHSYISIMLPQFRDQIIIDPHFSVLVDYYDSSDFDQSICSYITKKELGKRLRFIIGIIVGGFFALLIILLLIQLIIKDSRFINIKVCFLHLKYLFRYYTKYKDYQLKEF